MSETTTIKIKRSDAKFLHKLKKQHGLYSVLIVVEKIIKTMRRLKLEEEIITAEN